MNSAVEPLAAEIPAGARQGSPAPVRRPAVRSNTGVELAKSPYWAKVAPKHYIYVGGVEIMYDWDIRRWMVMSPHRIDTGCRLLWVARIKAEERAEKIVKKSRY